MHVYAEGYAKATTTTEMSNGAHTDADKKN